MHFKLHHPLTYSGNDSPLITFKPPEGQGSSITERANTQGGPSQNCVYVQNKDCIQNKYSKILKIICNVKSVHCSQWLKWMIVLVKTDQWMGNSWWYISGHPIFWITATIFIATNFIPCFYPYRFLNKYTESIIFKIMQAKPSLYEGRRRGKIKREKGGFKVKYKWFENKGLFTSPFSFGCTYSEQIFCFPLI